MRYTMGVEEIEPDRWLGWVFELPGCTCPAASPAEALQRAPDDIQVYLTWQGRFHQGLGPLFDTAPVEVKITEVFRPREPDGAGNSRAFFEDDKPPFKKTELADALELLAHSRRELMALVQPLSITELQAPIKGEVRGSLANILDHLAWAEWWYCDRLAMAFNREEMSEDPIAKLDQVRAWTRARLHDLVGERRVFEQMGEKWSARKLVRRTLWHELDHTAHIARILSGQPGSAGSYVEL